MGVRFDIVHSDIRSVLSDVPDDTFDVVIADPPYGINYARGSRVRAWDKSNIAFDPGFWADVGRVTKSGSTIVAFGHSRTSHRQAVAIEDAGLQLIDTLAWAKSHGYQAGNRDLQRLLSDAGHPQLAAEYSGMSTHLSPAYEPITIARNLERKQSFPRAIVDGGRGGFNVSATRISDQEWAWGKSKRHDASEVEDRTRRPGAGDNRDALKVLGRTQLSIPDLGGRLPGNLLLEHSETCVEDLCETGCVVADVDLAGRSKYAAGRFPASRFFTRLAYSPRAPANERPIVDGITGPTVKPQNLLAWLCALVIRPNDLVLDPFAGSGAITQAIVRAGGRAVAVERELAYVNLIRERMNAGAD
jgi:DNA modification methylase